MIAIRFDGPPGHTSGRFIEIERDGASINFGDWKQDGDDWLLELTEVAQLEASLGKCSIDGQEPALLIDAKEKGTYWLCADCMFESIQDKMRLEAENERLREHYTYIKAWANQPVGLLTVQQFIDAITRMCDDALKAGGDDVAE